MIKTFNRYFLRALAFFLALFLMSKLFPSYFGMIDVQALEYHNSYTNFKYDGQDLNIAQFYTFPSGNKPIIVNGALALSNDSSNLNFTGYMYINLNLCSDMNLISINTPNNIDNMYVYQSGQSCNFNGSSYKGKVYNIYFRIIKPSSRPVTYDGSFYLNISNEHSIEFINYYANPGGFPMNNNQSYTNDLNELKEILRNNNSSLKDSIDKNTEENKKTNDTIKDTDTTGASSSGNSFFNDFDEGSEGDLTDLVSLPLNFINHLNDKCKPFTLPMGNMGTVTIPCLSSLWSSSSFANIINIAKIILNGIICYKVGLNLLMFFKDLKDPDKDKLEVMDL